MVGEGLHPNCCTGGTGTSFTCERTAILVTAGQVLWYVLCTLFLTLGERKARVRGGACKRLTSETWW